MTRIYHITHLSNLPAILAYGCLYCDNERLRRRLTPRGIAHQHIKDRRARRAVPCGPCGVVADYVPFYFAPRSPMLYSIHKGFVEGYASGQRGILHLVTRAEAVLQAALSFVFTDGHADMELSHFYERLEDLTRIDWPLMKSRYWNDTLTDLDRKRRRQAEFLVHRTFPWPMIESIGVLDDGMAAAVRQVLQTSSHRPSVTVERAWYY